MREWIATFGGAGKAPIAPGTAGSLATTCVILVAYFAVLRSGLQTELALQLVLVVLLILASVATVWLGPWVPGHFGRKDPGPFVLDEVAGVCLTMLGQRVLSDARQLWVVLIGFIAFRIFDVLKPPPCRRLEKLPHGWGILADDLMAAVYANLLCQILIRVLFVSDGAAA